MKNILIPAVFCFFIFFATNTFAQTWQQVGNAGFTAGEASYTSIAIDTGGTPYLAYSDSSNSGKITVLKFADTGWALVGNAGFSTASPQFVNIAIDGNGTPYVVFEDNSNADKATVMKYNGTSWVTVGVAGFSAGQAHFTSIAIGVNDTPYVFYEDYGNGQKGTVMKYNGTSWVAVGVAGFSSSEVAYNGIVFNKSGTPYVVYQDYAAGNKITVMKYNGSSWAPVGSAGFSASTAYSTSIALDTSGTPYVVYGDYSAAVSGAATAMKYNGTSWALVGPVGFTPGESYQTCMSISSNSNIPYVAYQDWLVGYKVNTMTYNGSGWVTAGSPDFTAGRAEYISMATDRKGVPYVAYQDYGNGKKASVMKLSPAAVTGSDTFCVTTSIMLADTTSGGTWSSSNTSIATVGSTGMVTGVARGVATISYTVSGIASTMTITVDPCGTENVPNTNDVPPTLAVYPNPSHGSFVVDITTAGNLSGAVYNVTISNILGQKMKELAVPADEKTEVLMDAPPGVYFLSTMTANGSLSAKIMVE